MLTCSSRAASTVSKDWKNCIEKLCASIGRVSGVLLALFGRMGVGAWGGSCEGYLWAVRVPVVIMAPQPVFAVCEVFLCVLVSSAPRALAGSNGTFCCVLLVFLMSRRNVCI